ncbi:MAG TPA: hypothetical protein VFE94_04540 [Candidatus Paceibacterota bacterium]|nr:hypothetical protein [Candidatus Paceibacterota bacterium]
METFVKADIFFFVTTVAIFLVTILLAVALVYAIRILRDVQHMVRRAKEESDGLFEDISQLRAFIREKGQKVGAVHEIVKGIGKLVSSRKKPAKSSKKA